MWVHIGILEYLVHLSLDMKEYLGDWSNDLSTASLVCRCSDINRRQHLIAIIITYLNWRQVERKDPGGKIFLLLYSHLWLLSYFWSYTGFLEVISCHQQFGASEILQHLSRRSFFQLGQNKRPLFARIWRDIHSIYVYSLRSSILFVLKVSYCTIITCQ